jgi:hypothetical protein
MGIIGIGVDFNGDGSADGFIGCVVGGPESVCGKTFLPDSRLLFEQYLDLPNGPCIVLRCGFCKEDSVAYVDCPWCGAKDTWRHNRNIKFNSGWLECSRCLKRLGDNPCSKCRKTNSVLNFHLLMYASDEEEAAKREDELKRSRGFLGRMNRDQVERFIYVLTPHPFLIGPVNKQWLVCRFSEDPANNVLQFANSTEGPWDAAKDLPDLMQRLQKLKPLPGGSKASSKDVAAGKIQLSRVGVAEDEAMAGAWVKLPNGKTGGPFEKDVVLMNARQGKYPPGTVWSEQPDGPWLPVPGVKTGATPPPAPIAPASQWWIRTPDGKQSGPHTKEQLAKAAAAGRLPQGTVAADSPNGPWKKVQLRKQT